jgi:hypothetical protein
MPAPNPWEGRGREEGVRRSGSPAVRQSGSQAVRGSEEGSPIVNAFDVVVLGSTVQNVVPLSKLGEMDDKSLSR